MTGILAGLIGSFKKAALAWSVGTISAQTYFDGTYANLANGKYFAFGGNNLGSSTSDYQYSTNGTSWTQGTMPASTIYRATAANSSRILVLRNLSTVGYYSDNGTTWTATSAIAASNQSPTQAIWDGSRFLVAGGTARRVYYSTNGATSWAETTPSFGSGAVQGIGYDGSSRHIATSTTSGTEASTTTTFPSSWSTITMPSTGIWLCPVFGNSIWVATRAGSSSYGTSTNGTTWTSRTLPSNFSESTSDVYAKMIFTNGKFYYYYVNNVYSSTDGINWTTEATVTGDTLDNVNGWAVGEGKVIAFGYNSTTSGADDYLIGQ